MNNTLLLPLNPVVKYAKVRDVKSPSVGTKGSAGIDLFIPNDVPETTILPSESVLIPSGIKFNIEEGFALVAKNKSGVAVKRGLIKGAELIDSDYTGEVHIHLINTTNKPVKINAGDKIIQFVLMYAPSVFLEELSETQLYQNKETERGEGGFGSTGTN